ncbi:MAG: ion channel [Propionibacteriaceae bacterium]
MRALRMHPSGILLVVQLIGVLIYPFMETTGRRVVFEAFGALVLALAVWSVRSSAGRVSSTIAITLGVIASGLSITDAVHHSLGMQLAAAFFHAVFYFWAAGNLMGYMLADTRVTTDELFAVGATFTLVAWGFAYVFSILEALQPGCFIAAVNSDAKRTWVELLFLSFTNLSSTGLSDIIPVTAQARAVVMIEQLAGLGYVALFVSRLVGLQMSRHMAKSAAAGPEDSATADPERTLTVNARPADVGVAEPKADG